MVTPDRPLLSVIVPAHNGTKVLPLTLPALAASDLPRACWELIVVDDASSDATAELAASYADLVVRLAGAPHGPAYARNRGVERRARRLGQGGLATESGWGRKSRP